jgi:hypothetical protein
MFGDNNWRGLSRIIKPFNDAGLFLSLPLIDSLTLSIEDERRWQSRPSRLPFIAAPSNPKFIQVFSSAGSLDLVARVPLQVTAHDASNAMENYLAWKHHLEHPKLGAFLLTSSVVHHLKLMIFVNYQCFRPQIGRG